MSEGFLSRWARRKEAVRGAAQAEERAAQTPEAAESGPAPGPAEADGTPAPDAPPPAADPAREALAELPSLDALTPATDLSPFLRAGVPAALRNAALRRMWSLDPAIRDFVSEAREYAYDWNTPGGAPGFGPLLPGDDVKAMLGRLFGPAEARDEEPPQETPQETEAEAAACEAADARTETADPDPEAVSPVDLEGLPQPAVAADLVGAEPEHENAAAAPPPRPRLRRHGGAMPT